jgi:hypothetical protein
MDMHSLIVAVNIIEVPFGQLSSGLIVFLYLGPETLLPVASFIAGIIGVLLVFWRYIVSSIRKFVKLLFSRKEVEQTDSGNLPEITIQSQEPSFQEGVERPLTD